MFSRAHRAFTLIEVLVVVVIVGIVSAVVLLSTGLLEDDRNVREEARRIASLLELAADESLLQGRDLGLEVTQTGYRFVEFDPYAERWQQVGDDAFLRPRQLPDELYFDLAIEDRRVLLNPEVANLESEDEDNDREPSYAPHALIMSSGTLSPLQLAIRRDRGNVEYIIDVTPQGTIEMNSGADDAR